MTKPDPLNVPAWLDPYAITFDSRDGAWTHEIRFVLTPAGLKAWSLTTTPSGRSVGDPPPIDVDGAGINTGVLRDISFPNLRRELWQRAEKRFRKILDEREHTDPELHGLLDNEITRAITEASQAHPPHDGRTGRLRSSDSQRAQWALDILDHKDGPGYRKTLRAKWSEREGRQLSTKTIDTRMRRLRDSGWLVGYGRAASSGPGLEKWLEHHQAPKRPTGME